MKRLGTLCTTALAIAVCSFALMGCSNIDGKTGPSEPTPGAPKLPRKRRHRVASIKSTKTKSIPRAWVPIPKNSSPSTLR